MKLLYVGVGSVCVYLFISAFILDCEGYLKACAEFPDELARADIKTLGVQLKSYKEEHGHFPDDMEELIPTYVTLRARDPWGSYYRYDLENEEALLYTFDKDQSNEIIYERFK